MKKYTWLLILAVLIPVVSAGAQTNQAQTPPPPPGGPGDPGAYGPGAHFQGRGMRDSQIRRQLEQIKIWQMTKEMNLPTDKAEKFFPLYNKYNNEMRTITSTRRNAVSTLDSAIQSHASGGEINRQIKQILSFDDQLASTHARFIHSLEGILSPTEIARYMVFEQRFDREIRERIRGMMMQRGMRGRGR